jgi:RNA polymerase sigma-70 factor (ECF subfamily)
MIDWEEIVGRHGEIVWKTAYRVLGDHADASDCFQETFLAAVEFSDRQDVRDWPAVLQHLATARAIDRLRRRVSDANHRDAYSDVSQLSTGEPGPAKRAEQSELIDQLRQALTKLSEYQAEVYCLRCINGLSYEQIANQLGIEVNHVGVLLHRARASLRSLLGPCLKT